MLFGQLFSDNPNRDPSRDPNSDYNSVISSDPQRNRDRVRDPEDNRQQYNNEQFPTDQVFYFKLR